MQMAFFLLELFLSDEPENPDLLYNLGMAYSDQNNLERAIELLTKLVTNAPDHINGRVAMGVALLRAGKINEGISELETAVRQAPENLWAHRNLGAGLMLLNRYSEAADHICVLPQKLIRRTSNPGSAMDRHWTRWIKSRKQTSLM